MDEAQAVQVYNSLTRQKEPLVPIVAGKLGFYVCGITVYDDCHLGHARSMVCFDVIVRTLQMAGFDVTYIRNITDVDDKIIARALVQGVSVETLTQTCIDSMHRDAAALNCIAPTHEPRATESMDHIIQFIEALIDANVAYIADSGDVCFEVSRFPDYGKLSNMDLDKLLAGIRVDVAQSKRSALDFVLWKQAKPDEPQWPSPWGPGRPGWHIECSAMSKHALGETFDLHGGGLDLKFPHHENEIAQSEALSHKPLANYWLHVGLLQINEQKMSKSTGNFLTIQEALKSHHPEVIRYFLLSSHYRSPLNYAKDTILNAEKALTRLYQSIRDLEVGETIDSTWQANFNQAMFDDFNTPVALSVLFDLSHEINKTKSPILVETLKKLAGMLGLLNVSPVDFLQRRESDEESAWIAERVQTRWQAKRAGDWELADEIRAELKTKGIELEDNATGSTWRRLLSK